MQGCKCKSNMMDDKCKCGCMDDKCNCGDKDCKCSNSSSPFYPVCCNGICTVPRMDTVTMVAEGQGIIGNNDPEPEEPGEVPEENGDIAFKFFIGKKYSKYVGSICLVDFNEELFITSEKLECYHSPDHTKFVAIFHVEEPNGRSREISLYVTTQICNILPTVFAYSAPHCGEDDQLVMGGSVTSGTVVIAEKNAEEENGMAH